MTHQQFQNACLNARVLPQYLTLSNSLGLVGARRLHLCRQLPQPSIRVGLVNHGSPVLDGMFPKAVRPSLSFPGRRPGLFQYAYVPANTKPRKPDS